MEDPVSPRRRKIPAHYNDGEDHHHHKDVELLYRQNIRICRHMKIKKP